jgi:hypothetical protein
MSTNKAHPIDPDQGFRLEPEFPDGEFAEVGTERNPLVISEDMPLSTEAIIIAGHMGRITAKLEVEMQRLEETGLAIAQIVNGINPTEQASYAELCERLNDNKSFLDKAEEFIEPWKKLFYRPYQAVLARQTAIVGAPTASHRNGYQRRLAFERAVKAAEQAEALRLKKEQEDREAEARLNNAVKAEELGLSPQAVETILMQPSTAPTPQPAPMISRPLGVRKIPPNWQAELENKQEFWKWAKSQREMPAMLIIDQPTMNREAKTHRAMLDKKYPGWRGVNKGGD